MSMRPAPRMNRTGNSLLTTLLALVSLALTVAAVVLGYMAVRSANTLNVRDAFLAILSLLLVIALNS